MAMWRIWKPSRYGMCGRKRSRAGGTGTICRTKSMCPLGFCDNPDFVSKGSNHPFSPKQSAKILIPRMGSWFLFLGRRCGLKSLSFLYPCHPCHPWLKSFRLPLFRIASRSANIFAGHEDWLRLNDLTLFIMAWPCHVFQNLNRRFGLKWVQMFSNKKVLFRALWHILCFRPRAFDCWFVWSLPAKS